MASDADVRVVAPKSSGDHEAVDGAQEGCTWGSLAVVVRAVREVHTGDLLELVRGY